LFMASQTSGVASSNSGASNSTTTTTSSSHADIASYVVFRNKIQQNSSTFNPMDMHPVHPWLLYADQDNNIVVQNYITSQKILNFSIGQHDEERRELQLLQRRIPTLSALANFPVPFPLSGGSGTATSPNSLTVTSTLSAQNSPLSPASPMSSNYTLVSPTQNINMNMNMNNTLHRSPNNTVRVGAHPSVSNDHIVASARVAAAGDIGDNNANVVNEKLEKMGQVRFLHFYDKYTRAIKDRKAKTSQGKLQNVKAGAGTSVANTIGSDDYIVVVADNRIVFINYHSQRIREVKVPIFELKPPTSIEFFSNSPLVAFGCSDSTVRIWNVEKWELEKPLTGGHSKNNTTITKMKSIEVEGDLLVTAGSDGFTCLWNIRTGTLATQFPKVHEIIDISYDHVTGHILVLTSDRVVLIYDIVTMKEVSKVNCGKREFASVEPFYHPRFQQDIMLTMKNPAQVVLLSRSQSTIKEQVFDLDQILNPAKKDKVKLYRMMQHPLQPNLWLAWVNRSLTLLSTMASALPVYATAVQGGEHVYFPYNGFLNSLPLTGIINAERTVIKEIPIAACDPVRLEISPSGRRLSVHYVMTGQYQVYEIGAWKLLEKGAAIDVAWSGRGKEDGVERFGRVERVFDSSNDPVKKKKLTLGVLTTKKKKEEEATSKIVLKTREFPSNATQELTLHTNEDKLSSGLLLGVYHRENALGSSASASSTGASSPTSSAPLEPPIQTSGQENESKSLQLYDWWTLQPVGEQMPPPLRMYWDHNQTFCVFVYTNHFCLFKIRPSIQLVCRWPLTLTSALWHHNILFFSTANDIQCLFPNDHESSPLILASMNGVVFPEDLYEVSSGSMSNTKPNQSFSLLPQYRPAGPIALVEVNNEGLVVVDSSHRFYCLPLTHYLFKFLSLTQMELIEQAMKCAAMVDPKYHYLMAKFLTVRGYAKECLQLNRISNHLKFQICINSEAYQTALDLVPLIAEAIKSNRTALLSANPDENTLSYLGKKCIEIGHLCQKANNQDTAERAFKLATSLEPQSGYQELALHYIHNKKLSNLKEIQQTIQQLYPLESSLISLLVD
ncbi:hypothetical protein SAMD00019534_018240, partial [Acytostelium subglobosum LB1]|uniref:hypothetical protein n=1 Tax=Acytostelium subglobosum LB1 TaxID=1410327 RepID=UPI000644AB31